VIAYNKDMVKPGEITRYEDLADPKWRGKLCTRSSSHPYNLSLIASMVNHLGEAGAKKWVEGVKANLARDPKGGDTDQLRSVAAGECAIAIANQYYFVRLMRSPKPADRIVVEKVAIVLPNQADRGTQMNISGGGVLKHAPHPDAAVKFLEYLASDQAQTYFANGNNEWPTVPGVKLDNRALESLGDFKSDEINVAKLGQAQATAQKLADQADWR
jgi:iron(III) transport system substrate-binding protein